MANLEDINKQMQDENDRHTRVINDLKNKTQKENEHHQRTMEHLRAEKERAKQANQQLENFNKILNKALGV